MKDYDLLALSAFFVICAIAVVALWAPRQRQVATAPMGFLHFSPEA